MLIHCPHCQNKIRIVAESRSETATICPSCGSVWNPWDAETATLRTIPKKVGRFELLLRLGQGQFGEVWSAYDPELDRQVAIKLPRREDLDSHDVERFLREARAAAQLKHPNIVTLLEVGTDADNVYIVSDLIDGASLADRLSSGWKPTWKEAAELCQKLAAAIQHAHEQGVIHRDIKPANVLTNHKGELFLTDFGLAKRDAGEVTMTMAGGVLGTPAYMPPEQARGDGHNADARSDIYSLGVVLFELLTGIRPFKGSSQVLIQQILYNEPPALRSINQTIPKDLQTVCLKCLEKSPDQRYQTAQAVADELRRVLNQEPIQARPVPWHTHVARWSARNRRLATVLGACALLVVSLGIVGTHSYQQWKQDQPVLHDVLIKTYPAGATLTFVPVDSANGLPTKDKAVQWDSSSTSPLKLPAGEYRILANQEGYGEHEVMRTVPASIDLIPLSPELHHYWKRTGDGEVKLPTLVMIPETDWRPNTVDVAGGSVRMLPPKSESIDAAAKPAVLIQFPARQVDAKADVKAFSIAQHKLTRGEAIRIIESRCNLPTEVLGEWFPSQQECLKLLKALLLDNPLPDTLDMPLTEVSYDYAVSLAEFAGMRLITEEEYLYVATNRDKTLYPWGDDATQLNEWPEQVRADDLTIDPPGISGLYSGPAEWTSSWPIALPAEPNFPRPPVQINRVVKGHLGDSQSPIADGVYSRSAMYTTTKNQFLGIRLGRSKSP